MSKIKDFFMDLDKKHLYIFLGVFLFLILVFGSYFGFKQYQKNNLIPQVSGANFSLEYRKIPFDAKSIDIDFSVGLDKDSLGKNVSISPVVDGKAELKNGNTVSYKLSSNLKIGEQYTLYIKKDVKSVNGVSLKDDVLINFEAIAGVKVTKMIPDGKLQNISQNVIVLFNIPVVSLTNLSSRDKLPCPLTISPKIEGKCSWIRPNVLQFEPKDHWQGATEYSLNVADTPGFLYPVKESFSGKIRTSELIFNVNSSNPDMPDSFSPKDGIVISSNFEVNQEELRKNIELSLSGKIISAKTESIDGSERNFRIFPLNGAFEYSKTYNLKIKKGLNSKYGNIPFGQDQNISFASIDFLVSIDVNQNIYDASGSVIDTKSFYSNYNTGGTIPIKSMFINIELGEEVNLDKKYFAFVGTDGKESSVDISYIKDHVYGQTNSNIAPKLQDNKKKIRIDIKDTLKFDSKYKLLIKKGIISSIDKDIIKELQTTKELKLMNFKYLNNTQSCFYFTNNLYSKEEYGYIFYNTIDYNSGAISTIPDANNKGLYYDKDLICPTETGSIAHVFNTRFNPFTKYTIKIDKSLKDEYGNILGKDFSFNITTGDIAEEDKYLYSSLNKELNVIPSDIPIIVNIQSINLSKAKFEICEMDIAGYDHYMRNGYNINYEPNCIKKISKDLDLKNRNWNLSNNKFDLEKDIAGTTLGNIILIRGTTKFYNSDGNGYRWNGKEFLNVFIRENLSLTLEKSSGKDLIFASSFDGKVLPSDLSFESYDENFQKLNLKINFNKSKGVYELENTGNILIAKNSNYFGMIDKRSDLTSNYDFKYVSGVSSSEKDYLYVYTDRPLYKPKDTIYFKGLLRTFSPNGYHKSGIKSGDLDINDENGSLVRNIKVNFDNNSNFNGSFVIPQDLPLGKYSFTFKPADAKPDYMVLVNGDFYVEEYKKPVFMVNLDINEKTNYTFKDKIELKISPEYYFGGKMVNATYFKSLLVQNYFFDAKDYASYNFGNGFSNMECLYWGYCDYDDNILESGEGLIGPTGVDTWSYNLPAKQFDENKNDLGEKIYNFNVTVEDPDTKKQISKTQSIILHDTDGYVGISAGYYNTKKDGIKMEGVTLNYDAKPLAGKNVKIEVIKQDGKIVKKEGVDGVFYNDYQVEEKKESEFTITSDSKGEFSRTIITKGDGEYVIKATYTGKDGNSYTSSVGTYVSGESYVYWNSGNNTVTDLVADKNLLKVGDTASFTLKSPIKTGKAFITVEKDDGILDYFTQDIKSNGERIMIPVKDTYYPNFYVKVYLIGKDGANPLPIYKRALSLIKVNTAYKSLKVQVTPKKNRYLPGEKVTIKVKVTDENNKPIQDANGSLAIVDESLLALKGNPKKFPYSFFYDMKRFLGVDTYVSLMNLIEKLEVKSITDGEKGGAGEGEKGGLSKKKRGVFKDTAFWLADFKTDKNGELNITTDALPDNLTTWNIEALVSTPLDNKIGIGENTIVTTKKVILNDNLPRFFGSKDEVILSPVVFNKTGKDSDFAVSLNATNLSGNNSQNIFLKNGEQKTINFSVKINDIGISGDETNFVSKVIFKAVSKVTNDLDETEMIIPIKETSIKETVATNGKINGSSTTERIDLGDNVKDTKISVNFSATLISSIFSAIDYLKNYPYGCIEQIASSIMPTVYLKELYDKSGISFDLDKKFVKKWIDSEDGYIDVSLSDTIKDFLINMKNFQVMNGGFAYWQDSVYNSSDFYLTSYIVENLSRIRDVGFRFDEKVINNAISYLKNRFYENRKEGCLITRFNDCKYPESYRLKAISAILSFNKDDYEAFKMWKLINFRNPEISTNLERLLVISKLVKIPSLAASDKDSLNKQGNDIIENILNNNLSYDPRGAFLSKDNTYSRLQNTAKFIDAIYSFGYKDLAKIDPVTQNLISWIMSQKKDGSFGSTQDNIIVVKAMITFIESTGELKNTNLDLKLSMNTENILDQKIDDKNKLDVFSKVIIGDKLQKNNTLNFSKIGNGRIYYDLAYSYFVQTDKIESRDEGFYLDVKYFDYAEYRKIEALKNDEYVKYLSGEIDYGKLKYPKEIINYLNSIKSGKVGQLVIAYNNIITGEDKDQVAFEGYIPSGSELVNTNLSTEAKSASFPNFFERTEFRDDRFFGYVNTLGAGIYDFNYVLRLTHNGVFNIKPSNIFEFYHPEVFGRNEGRVFEVKK